MIQLRMTSSPAKKLAFDSELVTLSRLLVRTITIGGRVNWKTPKMERQVSFLLQNFRNGMSVLYVCVGFSYKRSLASHFSPVYFAVLQDKTCLIYSLLYQPHTIQMSLPRILSCQPQMSSYLQSGLCFTQERKVYREAESDHSHIVISWQSPVRLYAVSSLLELHFFKCTLSLSLHMLSPTPFHSTTSEKLRCQDSLSLQVFKVFHYQKGDRSFVLYPARSLKLCVCQKV